MLHNNASYRLPKGRDHIQQSTNEVDTPKQIVSKELKTLKHKYAQLFEEPKELPPARGVFDHKITLEPGARPVNIRTYRYL